MNNNLMNVDKKIQPIRQTSNKKGNKRNTLVPKTKLELKNKTLSGEKLSCHLQKYGEELKNQIRNQIDEFNKILENVQMFKKKQKSCFGGFTSNITRNSDNSLSIKVMFLSSEIQPVSTTLEDFEKNKNFVNESNLNGNGTKIVEQKINNSKTVRFEKLDKRAPPKRLSQLRTMAKKKYYSSSDESIDKNIRIEVSPKVTNERDDVPKVGEISEDRIIENQTSVIVHDSDEMFQVRVTADVDVLTNEKQKTIKNGVDTEKSATVDITTDDVNNSENTLVNKKKNNKKSHREEELNRKAFCERKLKLARKFKIRPVFKTVKRNLKNSLMEIQPESRSRKTATISENEHQTPMNPHQIETNVKIEKTFDSNNTGISTTENVAIFQMDTSGKKTEDRIEKENHKVHMRQKKKTKQSRGKKKWEEKAISMDGRTTTPSL